MAITTKPELYGYGIKTDDSAMGAIKIPDRLSFTASVPENPKIEIAIPAKSDERAIIVEGAIPYIPVT